MNTGVGTRMLQTAVRLGRLTYSPGRAAPGDATPTRGSTAPPRRAIVRAVSSGTARRLEPRRRSRRRGVWSSVPVGPSESASRTGRSSALTTRPMPPRRRPQSARLTPRSAARDDARDDGEAGNELRLAFRARCPPSPGAWTTSSGPNPNRKVPRGAPSPRSVVACLLAGVDPNTLVPARSPPRAPPPRPRVREQGRENRGAADAPSATSDRQLLARRSGLSDPTSSPQTLSAARTPHTPPPPRDASNAAEDGRDAETLENPVRRAERSRELAADELLGVRRRGKSRRRRDDGRRVDRRAEAGGRGEKERRKRSEGAEMVRRRERAAEDVSNRPGRGARSPAATPARGSPRSTSPRLARRPRRLARRLRHLARRLRHLGYVATSARLVRALTLGRTHRVGVSYGGLVSDGRLVVAPTPCRARTRGASRGAFVRGRRVFRALSRRAARGAEGERVHHRIVARGRRGWPSSRLDDARGDASEKKSGPRTGFRRRRVAASRGRVRVFSTGLPDAPSTPRTTSVPPSIAPSASRSAIGMRGGEGTARRCARVSAPFESAERGLFEGERDGRVPGRRARNARRPSDRRAERVAAKTRRGEAARRLDRARRRDAEAEASAAAAEARVAAAAVRRSIIDAEFADALERPRGTEANAQTRAAMAQERRAAGGGGTTRGDRGDWRRGARRRRRWRRGPAPRRRRETRRGRRRENRAMNARAIEEEAERAAKVEERLRETEMKAAAARAKADAARGG